METFFPVAGEDAREPAGLRFSTAKKWAWRLTPQAIVAGYTRVGDLPRGLTHPGSPKIVY